MDEPIADTIRETVSNLERDFKADAQRNMVQTVGYVDTMPNRVATAGTPYRSCRVVKADLIEALIDKFNEWRDTSASKLRQCQRSAVAGIGFRTDAAARKAEVCTLNACVAELAAILASQQEIVTVQQRVLAEKAE